MPDGPAPPSSEVIDPRTPPSPAVVGPPSLPAAGADPLVAGAPASLPVVAGCAETENEYAMAVTTSSKTKSHLLFIISSRDRRSSPRHRRAPHEAPRRGGFARGCARSGDFSRARALPLGPPR